MRHHWQLPPPKSWWPSIPDHPPFVGNQTVQDLLPDTLLVLGNGASLAPFLNSHKPVLQGVHVARRSAFPFTPAMRLPSCAPTTTVTAATAFSLDILVAS